MSIKVMDLVLDNFKRGGSEKLVMIVLANWCDDRGLNLYPSMDAVAEKACLSKVQARRVVHTLVDDGYLEVIGNHDGGARHATRRYRMIIEKLLAPSDVIHTTIIGDTPITGDSPITGESGSGENTNGINGSKKSDLSTRVSPMRANTLNNNNKKHTQKSPSVSSNPDVVLPAYVSDELIADYKRILDKKRGTLTNALLNKIMKEAAKAGLSLEQAIQFCCEHQWATFDAVWYWQRLDRDSVLPDWVFSAKGHEEMARNLHLNRISSETEPVFFKRVRAAAGIDESKFEQAKQFRKSA